jgi:hypothetical protein
LSVFKLCPVAGIVPQLSVVSICTAAEEHRASISTAVQMVGVQASDLDSDFSAGLVKLASGFGLVSGSTVAVSCCL